MKYVKILILFLSLQTAVAQDMVFFNDLNSKAVKKDAKVEKTIQGIEFSADPFKLLPERHIVTYLQYFHENRIGNTWTLNKSAGFGNSFYRYSVLQAYIRENGEVSYYGTSSKMSYYYYVSLEAMIEPRWYFSLRNRFVRGENIQRNSGWFLAFPLRLSSGILQQPGAFYSLGNKDWWPRNFSLHVKFHPTIGFRNAFLKNKLLFEASLGYSPLEVAYWSSSNKFWLSDAYYNNEDNFGKGFLSLEYFQSRLKLAYVF